MSTDAFKEPTVFELDVYFAAGGDTDLAEHVQSCERCAAYLAQLSNLQAPALVPRSTAGVTSRRTARRLVAAGAFLSACAAVMLWLNAADPYVGPKGLPAVQVLIHSARQARVWDGKTPVRAGDAIALRTDCNRFAHVTVAVADGGNRSGWKRVFEGQCSEHQTLPFTLVADAKPGNERIEVVFSRSALDDALLHQALTSRERTDTTWVNTLILPKSGSEP